MFEKLWEIIQTKDSLLDQSRTEAISMLNTCKEMFDLTRSAIKHEADPHLRKRIQKSDKQINRQQREVRMMVFEHLSISSDRDLLTGLQLLNIVIDIERIGDYTKNIADLLDMLPKKLDFQEYGSLFEELEAQTLQAFDATIKGLKTDGEEHAKVVTDNYEHISERCERSLKDIITAKTSDDSMEKRDLAMVLLLRYLKRVNAHLKNIATTIVNPFHRIGYQPR